MIWCPKVVCPSNSPSRSFQKITYSNSTWKIWKMMSYTAQYSNFHLKCYSSLVCNKQASRPSTEVSILGDPGTIHSWPWLVKWEWDDNTLKIFLLEPPCRTWKWLNGCVSKVSKFWDQYIFKNNHPFFSHYSSLEPECHLNYGKSCKNNVRLFLKIYWSHYPSRVALSATRRSADRRVAGLSPGRNASRRSATLWAQGIGDWELFSQGISARASMWDMQEASCRIRIYNF